MGSPGRKNNPLSSERVEGICYTCLMASRRFLLPLMLVLLPCAMVENARGDTYTSAERARLRRGEIITRYWKVPGREVGRGWAAGVINASPEAVFAVVGDVERYGKVFPRVINSKVMKRRSPTSYDWFYRIDMPWPLSDHWCITRNTHLLNRKQRRYTRRWRLLKGTFVHNQGFWLVRPWGKGKALLYYSVMLKPRVTAPDFVLHHVSRVALPRSVKSMRRRVRQLKRQGKLKAIPTTR